MQQNTATPVEAGTVGGQIIRAMDARNLSESQLAARTHMPAATIHRKLHHPCTWTVGELFGVAAALGTTFDRLLLDGEDQL